MLQRAVSPTHHPQLTSAFHQRIPNALCQRIPQVAVQLSFSRRVDQRIGAQFEILVVCQTPHGTIPIVTKTTRR